MANTHRTTSPDGVLYFSKIFLQVFTSFKPVFHKRFFTREATVFFCLSLISFTWFQPKAQEQREKVASRDYLLVETGFIQPFCGIKNK